MAQYLDSQFTKREAKAHSLKAAWWDEPEKTAHEALFGLNEIMRHEQRHRDEMNRMHYGMYTGRGVTSLDGMQYARPNRKGHLQINLARTQASAANSKIASNKVRVLHLTEGGNFYQQARAKRLTKVINGTFLSSGFYEENRRAQLDSCIFDVGATYFYRDGEKIKCQRIPGNEIRVDYLDARYGRPSQLHRELVLPRGQLKAMFPKKKKEIDKAPSSRKGNYQENGTIADCVEVIQAWKLADGPDLPGKYCVSIDGATLKYEDYPHDFFPMVFHTWEPNPFGFYGQSICSILYPIQFNASKTIADIQDHSDLSTGFVALQAGSNLNVQALTNEAWRICEYNDVPPQFIAPPAFQRDKVDWLEWLVARGYEENGMSQLYAASQKPAGLDSSVALREFNDQTSERFNAVEERYVQTYVQADKIIRSLYEEIYQNNKAFKIPAYGAKTIEQIDWEKARMDEEDYLVKPVPTSFLPSTPAGKLQAIQEMMQSGLLGKEEAMLLLDYPDLERVSKMQQAPLLNIHRIIDIMTDADNPRPVTPEPTLNLPLALKLASQAYNEAISSGAPDEILENLLDFMSGTEALMNAAQPQEQMMPPAAMPPEQMAMEPSVEAPAV